MNADGPYFVYILTNRTRTLYTGMTNDLKKRVWQHKQKRIPGFTAKYNVNQLVWFDSFPTADQAIAAEKRIKGWLRWKKIELIQQENRRWHDYSVELLKGETANRSLRETSAEVRKPAGSQ